MSRILVKSVPSRFRRAGFEFTHEARVIDTGELSAEQLKAIEDEPQLVVVPLADAAVSTDPKSGKAK